ncbi:MAG: transglutaminase-like domain-containing protein [Bacteroidales bacterium]|nr:transglutaminase-like domain-containing protein [Bacteroidales bacterium]
MKTDPELKYLVTLFDDPDEVVTESVNKRILGKGESVLCDLDVILKKENEPHTRNTIFSKMSFFNTEFKLSQLEEYVLREDVSLYEGGYLISSLLSLELTREDFGKRLLPLSVEFMSELSEDKTAIENVKIFNHIFYKRLKFKSCDPFIKMEENALLFKALETKSANPIALSLIYFILAQEEGLPIYPLCFPGGFVPVYVENDKELFYINIFRDGEIFLEDRLKNFMTDQGLEYDRDNFEVRDETVLLVIYLESLYFYYSSKENNKMVSILERALDCFGEERFLSVDEEEQD